MRLFCFEFSYIIPFFTGVILLFSQKQLFWVVLAILFLQTNKQTFNEILKNLALQNKEKLHSLENHFICIRMAMFEELCCGNVLSLVVTLISLAIATFYWRPRILFYAALRYGFISRPVLFTEVFAMIWSW